MWKESGRWKPCQQYLVTVKFVPSAFILSHLMMAALRSTETSVVTTAKRRHIPQDNILHSHRSENLKSYIAFTGWTL
jgi:hypothetical protein